jgi:hypothetical protein
MLAQGFIRAIATDETSEAMSAIGRRGRNRRARARLRGDARAPSVKACGRPRQASQGLVGACLLQNSGALFKEVVLDNSLKNFRAATF